jgi:hypothetical protein
MKRFIIILLLLATIGIRTSNSQSVPDTSIYLITCGTGTETYSIYGHSAIRIEIPAANSDMVYNWGVFDFDTPHFAWKFAKGRLLYMIDEASLQSFLREYVYEKRYVISQKLNINSQETRKIVELINENLKPENRKYKYDFFYDDCSTRIRDIFEKGLGNKMLYPPDIKGDKISFRKLVAKYQAPFRWLQFGIDLIMGSTSDKTATYRDMMFLPLEMQKELSETVVNRNGKMIPFMKNPKIILDFPPVEATQNFLLSPVSVFTFVLILIIIVSAWMKSKKILRLIDISLFSIFSILGVMMIFFNFFTDHIQMRINLNIIWLNPLLLVCLILLILKKEGHLWFRIQFYLMALFIAVNLILPQEFNIAFFPIILIIMIRSLFRGEFEWNPFLKK